MKPYQKYLALINALEDRYTPRLTKQTIFIYSSFTSDLKTYGLDVARSNLQNIIASDGLIEILTDIYTKAGLRGAIMTLAELKVQAKEQKGFGRNEIWIRNVLQFLRLNILEFAAKITATIREDILRIVAKADEGLGIDKIVGQIESSEIPRARARVIARTEIVRAANVGHSVGAKEFPFEVNKKWIAAKDHRTRHSHKYINNHLVDENGFFDVPVYEGDKRIGTEQMLYPGDSKASAGNVINCRCRIVHEPKLDAEGNYIRRSHSATVIPLRAFPAQQLPRTGIAATRKAIANAVFIGVKESE